MSKLSGEQNWKQILIIMTAAILAGVVGAYVFSYLVNWYVAKNNLIAGQFTEKYGPDSRIIIQDAKKIVVEQDAGVAESINAGENLLVGFYKKNTAGEYNLKEVLGQALVVSTDGWLLTANANIKTEAEWQKYVVITHDKKVYNIEKAIKDKISAYWLVKMANANSLAITSFVPARDLTAGQLLLGLGWEQAPAILYYRGSTFKQEVHSSDYAGRFLAFSGNGVSESFAILNLSHQVIGLANAGRIEAVDYILPLVNGIANNSTRPTLGLNYQDLNKLVGKKDYKGVRITKLDGVAIVKNSPADKAGLKEGDIILAIDNVELNEDNDLAELLSAYKAKTNIYLKYKRGTEEKVVEIKLD